MNLERITELDPLINRMACLWATRTGEDADELYSSFHFEITQRAMLRPDFLDVKNNANYIITYGVRQTINNHRRRKSHDASAHAQSLDEDGMDEWLDGSTELAEVYTPDASADAQPDASAVLAQLADALDESGQAVLNLARNLGDKAFKRNGTLNVNKIAALSGCPQRTLYRHLNALRSDARAMLNEA
jgi:Fic family protein